MKPRNFLLGLALSVCTLAHAGIFSPNEFRTSNFIDDSLVLVYTTNTADTSKIIGLSSGHPEGPDLGLWKTFFWRVTPDTASRFADTDVKFWIQEVDFNRKIGDTVFTIMADTSADTTTTTGAATDTSWTKVSFAPNPASGYRVLCSAQAACSTPAKLELWFRFVKKIGIFN